MKQRLFIIALLAAPLLWLFGRALMSDEMFVFRDAAHYYYPYYHYVAEQWGQGYVPLWNPLENLGQPLLADPTAAVLYPGKLIFVSPLSYDTNYKLYIVGHVLLAAINSFIAARGFARSPAAATVCALSYAFSGAVVFQYCNVVFLVGAAWLPLAILATQRMLVLRRWRWAIRLAVVLALMVLGGDPQMAYHVGLMAGIYAILLWWTQRRKREHDAPSVPGPIGLRAKLVSNRLVLLALAGGCAFALAAVQILPSMQWTRHTTRAATDVPRNIYELASGAGDRERPSSDRYAFLLGQTDDGHHEGTHQFSVGPWHLAGYLWPNCYGNFFPENTRWIRTLPAEGRMWTPTLYMGLLPLLLALSQFSFWTPATPNREATNLSNLVRVWLTWLVVLSLLASLGWYGAGWLASEIYHAIYGVEAEPLSVGWSFGGVYWLLQTILPGYVYFRYPAKWLVITSLALAMLAAYGWDGLIDQASDRTRRFVRRALLVVLGLSMVAGVVAKTLIFDYSTWERMCRLVPDDALFGPVEIEVAGWTVVGALVHAIVLCALLLWFIQRPRRGPANDTQLPRWHVALLLSILVGDLCMAQTALFPIASTTSTNFPMAAMGSRSFAVISIARDRQRKTLFGRARREAGLLPTRLYRQIGTPLPPSDDKLLPGDKYRQWKWEQDTLLPKYHLLYGTDMVESSSAMRSRDVNTFMNAARRHGPSNDDGDRFPDLATLEMVGVEYSIVDSGQWPLNMNSSFWRVRIGELSPEPRARVMYDVIVLPVLESPSSSATRRRTEEMFDTGRVGGQELRAVIETDRQLPNADAAQPSHSVPEARPCEILTYTPQRVELLATLKQDGLVILADAYEPNWVCEVTNLVTGEVRQEPILRTNRVLRGVWLPAGDYKLAFHYRPWSFRGGAILSGCGWLGVLLGGTWAWRLNRRPARGCRLDEP